MLGARLAWTSRITDKITQCIYAVLKHVIFYIDDDAVPEGEAALAEVLERQISYFADIEGFEGLLKHLGDSPLCQVFETLRNGFNEEHPREPFALWDMEHIDSVFKDLIRGLTNFDPAKRITANEALQHRWFADI